MEERRRGGFRVKPSFGQVLGYIQEGEPLALDLPKRNASIYTSSHFYLDDYPNAPEPVSETPLPHTSINPAAAFETADEGYDGVPFPRPPREFTRPSFLPDSDDGGTDPGQALRNDGLNPPRPPTLGGRLRESGIQAAETVIAGAAAGAAAATRSVSENQTMNVLRGGGDWLDRTLFIPRRPPGLAPPPDEVPAPQIIGRPSEVEPLLQRAGQRAAEVERQAAQDIERFASQQMAEAEATEGLFASAAEVAAAGAETAAAVETGGALTALGEGALAVAGAAGAATGGLVTAWAIEGGSHRGLAHAGLGRGDGRRLAALPSHGRPDSERHARFRRRGSLLHPRAAAAAAGLPDRHGLRERAAGPASATDSSSPHPAPGPGPAAAHALRHQPGAHPGELRERTFPHQPAVPGRPWAAGHAVLRRPSHGERTGSCIMYKGWRT